MALNVLGTELQACSYAPLTGFFRDGCCRTGNGSAEEHDPGRHLVCTKVSADFLAFSVQRGNDLSTPRPEFRFRGLRPGDRWCLCVLRWKEAFEAGVAPPVVLAATHHNALQHVTLAALQSCALADLG